MSRRTVIVSSVVVLAVGAGVVWAVLANREPFGVSGYEAMCEKPQPFEQAAPRGAAGPHPVHLADDWVDTEPGEEPIWSPDDPASVQLVACTVSTGKSSLIKRCEYSRSNGVLGVGGGGVGYTIDLFNGYYRLDLYEARTGTLVVSEDVVGDRFIGNSFGESDPCQDSVRIFDESKTHSENVGRPSSQALRTALGEHVLR